MERLIPTSANGTIPNLYFIGRWVPKKLANRSVMYTTNLGAQVTFEVQNAASVSQTSPSRKPSQFLLTISLD